MKTQSIKAQWKKSRGGALLLVVFGLLALYGGPGGLALLIPAAILVWHALAEPATESHRD